MRRFLGFALLILSLLSLATGFASSLSVDGGVIQAFDVALETGAVSVPAAPPAEAAPLDEAQPKISTPTVTPEPTATFTPTPTATEEAWDHSYLEVLDQGWNCDDRGNLWVVVSNEGDAMEKELSWELYRGKRVKDAIREQEGSASALEAGESYAFAIEVDRSAIYWFRILQHPAYPGEREVWSNAIDFSEELCLRPTAPPSFEEPTATSTVWIPEPTATPTAWVPEPTATVVPPTPTASQPVPNPTLPPTALPEDVLPEDVLPLTPPALPTEPPAQATDMPEPQPATPEPTWPPVEPPIPTLEPTLPPVEPPTATPEPTLPPVEPATATPEPPPPESSLTPEVTEEPLPAPATPSE